MGPVYLNWGRIYTQTTRPTTIVNYEEVPEVTGSEQQAIFDVIARNTDYGATEQPATVCDYLVRVAENYFNHVTDHLHLHQRQPDLQLLPVVGSAIALIYNFPCQNYLLTLDGITLGNFPYKATTTNSQLVRENLYGEHLDVERSRDCRAQSAHRAAPR